MSVFDQYRKDAWPYEYAATIYVPAICGGVPGDEKVAEGWLRSKLADKDDLIRSMVAEVMVEREVSAEEAAALVDEQKHINGFKRNGHGLYIEGRQIKAAIKEAVSVAADLNKVKVRGLGNNSRKGIISFVAEHVVVLEDQVLLGRDEPTGIHQRFIHKGSAKGKISAIHYEEYVENAELSFTVLTDFEFSEKDWAMIWLTGEQQGLGASRSQGFGRYEVTRWERVKA